MSSGPQPEHMTKSRLVEDIIALIHNDEGVTIEQNVMLPVLSDPEEKREIDVLITGNVAGYDMRIPIECKNYGPPITKDEIAIFVDKLEDVGLSVRDSIFVCISGFDRNARRRAEHYGIKLFTLEGLTDDRLSSAVHQAFQSTAYLLLRVERVKLLAEEYNDDLWIVMFMKDRLGNMKGGIWDIIWNKWNRGEIPWELGDHDIMITPPPGWQWHLADPMLPEHVFVSLKVIGLVLTTEGEGHVHLLKDIFSGRYERKHIQAIFNENPQIKLTVVETDEELECATRPGGVANIVFETEPAPRIHIFGKLYWPPTERAFQKIRNQVGKMMVLESPDWDSLNDLTFEQIEGTDISAIWAKGWSGHPANRGEDWPVRFPGS